jgi:hypothetical protein
MPSPFPGMDPYLEKPSVFAGFHDQFIAYLVAAIQPLLPAPYFAKSGQRVWVELADRIREPDVSVATPATWRDEAARRGGTAVAEQVASEPIVVTVERVLSGEFKETFVDVFTAADGDHRLVTSIELLSPSNKNPGEQAGALYREKQQEFLSANVNLVEIDLLRAGDHATLVPRREMLKHCKSCDYHVCIHRFEARREFLVYPIQLPQKLPIISVPLLPGAPAIPVDLQAVMNRCYDDGPYQREVNYADSPPPPALTPERLAWVKSLLAAREKSTVR